MRNGTAKYALAGILAFVFTITAAAQQVRFFPDFSSMAYLQTNGPAAQAYSTTTTPNQYVLRLSPGAPPVGHPNPEPSSSTFFTVPQSVNSGFTTYFRFQIHTAPKCCAPGEGLAFVVQNAASTDPTYGAIGAGITARGVGNGGVGYAGIPNSLAVEFDTLANAWDPTVNGANHVAVQSCGIKTNGPVHTAGTYTIYKNNNVTSCLVGSGLNNNSNLPHLGVTCAGSSCADGVPHDVVIEYAPVNNVWTLMVYLDPKFITGTHTPVKSAVPVINIPYNIDATQNPVTGLALAPDSNGNKSLAWVGFTAAQSAQPEQQDILAWEFTPHTTSQVTQQIPPGGVPAHYTFGGHDTVVTYYPGYVNNGCDGVSPNDPCEMTVLATPISRSLFYQTRLLGTPFINEQCIVYLGTGGNCIVYSVTCQKQSDPKTNVTCPASLPTTCNNIGDPGCIIFSTSFYTTDGVTTQNADYLKTDPIGSNNWKSIFQSYQPSVFDGKTTGTSGGTSDFVATFALGTKP